MVNERTIEISVGLLMLFAFSAMLVLAFKVSGLTTFWQHNTYEVKAYFDNVGDLKVRSAVAMGGVKIGQVSAIDLDPKSLEAIVTMQIDEKYNTIPADVVASIYTAGLVGSNYISFEESGIGFDEEYLQEGDIIIDTRRALILQELVGQFLFRLNGSSEEKTAE